MKDSNLLTLLYQTSATLVLPFFKWLKERQKLHEIAENALEKMIQGENPQNFEEVRYLIKKDFVLGYLKGGRRTLHNIYKNRREMIKYEIERQKYHFF